MEAGVGSIDKALGRSGERLWGRPSAGGRVLRQGDGQGNSVWYCRFRFAVDADGLGGSKSATAGTRWRNGCGCVDAVSVEEGGGRAR